MSKDVIGFLDKDVIQPPSDLPDLENVQFAWQSIRGIEYGSARADLKARKDLDGNFRLMDNRLVTDYWLFMQAYQNLATSTTPRFSFRTHKIVTPEEAFNGGGSPHTGEYDHMTYTWEYCIRPAYTWGYGLAEARRRDGDYWLSVGLFFTRR